VGVCQSTNILRNILKVLKPNTPAYRAIDFLYFILSFEIIHKIPFLSDYLNKKQEEEAAVQGA